ncbi:NAD(P)-dependent oxidoreductase [Edaphobacillus lindanitolerans]|uniref:3-hydroxyisobutyrate dehydrogenase n=1 Tax=Edaphobacillus lindanitolerans TaxID=550447 RepID=A0A1U7PM20_9BACI|nr:NAD(P)-dependent oxidoreductase [Edaphobacillus lindanitolerans]SIT68431.1 3-hydroxyisobutyrate dehydrogenase [Edaphobacillus lindanitolerans]
MDRKRIGFIGTGVMGTSIVRHFLRAGHEVTVYTRTKSKAEQLIGEGAHWAASPAEAAAAAEAVMTMVGYPADVEEVYFGGQGVFSAIRPGTVVADMTTSSPQLAIRIAEEAEKLGCRSVDAPVSGGDVGARNGTLSIMCGGSAEAFLQLEPFFKLVGSNIIHHGPAGSGQHVKMSNQVAIATNMIGVCEALAYAIKAGLDPERVLKSIATGAAGSWSLSNLAPRMLEGDFAPGFYVKHFLKDLRIVLEEARVMELELPGVKLAEQMYAELSGKGFGDDGTQALYKLYI